MYTNQKAHLIGNKVMEMTVLSAYQISYKISENFSP